MKLCFNHLKQLSVQIDMSSCNGNVGHPAHYPANMQLFKVNKRNT